MLYESHVVARRRYLRKASCVMDCLNFNAHEPKKPDEHRFNASWQPRFGHYLLTIREEFPKR